MNHNMNDLNRRKRSYEVHAMEQASHAYPANMVAPSAAYSWHDMEYSSPPIDTARFAPTSAPVQYNHQSAMMSFSPVDYTRHDYTFNGAYSDADGSVSVHPPGLYRVGPFRYADLANMDGDAGSVSQESIYSRSTRIHSLTDSERRDSQPNSILSSNDIRRESEGYDRIFPVNSIDSENYHNDARGHEPSSLDLSNLVPIEECTSVPGMNSSPHFVVPRPHSNPSRRKEQTSPIHATTSGLTSPTTLTFHEANTMETSKVLKPKRMPRSKSASGSIGDGSAVERASKLRARQAHSLVERKYRDNLNLKISQLHQTLQNTKFGPKSALQSPQKETKLDYFDEETVMSPDIPNERSSTGSTPTGSKVRKSDVLTEAMSYVNATEVEMSKMTEEIIRLNARVKSLQKMVRCEDCNLLKGMVTLDVEGQQAGQRPEV